jgi:hypothetical protein
MMRFRDDQRMAFHHGADVHKDQDIRILVEAGARDLPLDDFAKNAVVIHALKSTRITFAFKLF